MIDVLPSPLPTRSRRGNALAQHNFLASLFIWRRKFGFGYVEAAVLTAYCAVLALVIPSHEPWSDEAQAWLLARDNSTWEIIRHRLHYEGAPGLWHLLIKLFQHAHGTFTGFAWFGAAFAIAGVYVFLRWSPFPLIIRILLPFTYFIQYQYAVISRSYDLFPLLVFALCALFWRRRHIVLFSVLAGLLANLSMQGVEFASVLSCLYAIELWREHRNGFVVQRRKLVTAVALFALLTVFACYTAIPAPDVNFAVSDTVSSGPAHDLLVRIIGETQPVFSKPPLPGPNLPPMPERPEPGFLPSPAAWAAWQFNHQPSSSVKTVEEFAISMATQAAWSLSTWNLLACAFLGITAVWLRSRRRVRMLLPWLVLLGVGEVIWVSDHHLGMLLVALLAGLWLASQAKPHITAPRWIDLVFTSSLALILVLQVGWTITASRKELRGNYDPGKETAEFLQQNPVPKTAAFNYWAESIQPYFDRNPFYNIPSRYRIWSSGTNPDPYYQEALESHPDRIVYSVEFPGPGTMRNQWMPLTHIPTAAEKETLPWDQAAEYIRESGYVETHRFCGRRFARLSYSYMDCDLIFEPAGKVGSSLARTESVPSK